MKYLLFLLLLAGCTPVKYVMVDPKDSTKLVEVRKRIIYEDIYMPLYFNTRPYYYTRPIIIQRPIVIPQRPIIQPNRWNRPLPPRPSRKN
jgi:hypothetical protein